MRLSIALRYFFSHKRQSLVCIAGVTLSVTMFIAMVALMDGFEDKFIIETVESSGHISIKDEPRETRTPVMEDAYPKPGAVLALERAKPREQVQKIDSPMNLIHKLEHMPGIVGVAPEVYGDVIATYGTKTVNLSLFGVDPDRQTRVTTIGNDLLDGSFTDLRRTADGVILGKGIADTIGAGMGDKISLSSSTGGRTTARVVGIFRTGVTPVDYSRGYMYLTNVQTLVDKKNVVNKIVIRTDDYTKAEAYAAQIESLCGYRTESWQESNANFLKIFSIQTLITYIITGALLVVAAFGVLNILIMAVLERVNDIAILKSFGLSRADITLIYLYQGIIIGLIGSTVGLICGKLAIEGLRRIPITLEGLIRTEGLLMSEHASQYYSAFISAMAVVMIAAVYPAWRAAKFDPVEVIRGAHEAAILEAQGVYRVLGSGETPTLVLRGVDLTIRPREYVSIVGASGSGKSTLLYLLGGLDRPTPSQAQFGRMTRSRVLIDGLDTTTLGDAELASLRNARLGFVFQFHYLLRDFTAQENVCLPMLKLARLSKADAMERAAELLRQFGLGDKLRRRANRLSGGEQQRVAIARALANKPAVLLADEPTGNLDRANGDRVAHLLQELATAGQAIVMVTHDLTLAARAGRRVTMEDGRIISDLTSDEGVRG